MEGDDVDLLTAQELARELKVTVDTIWRYTRNKRIPSIQLGPRDYRYQLPAVMSALAYTAAVAPLENPESPLVAEPALRPISEAALAAFAGRLRGGDLHD